MGTEPIVSPKRGRRAALTLPAFVTPATPRLVASPLIGPAWSHEPKMDGWRVELAKAGDQVALYSRTGFDLAPQARAFAARAAADIPEPRLLLDGELVAIGADNRIDFRGLAHALSTGSSPIFFFAFDILERGPRDLRRLPLKERRQQLYAVLNAANVPWLASVTVVQDGAKLLSACESLGFEGIVSKREDQPYRSGRRSDWLKVKCDSWHEANRERFETQVSDR